jgi:hypothetical protein
VFGGMLQVVTDQKYMESKISLEFSSMFMRFRPLMYIYSGVIS